MTFLIIFFVGLLLTVLVFAVGELFDLGDADADTGGEAGHGGPSPLSSRILFVFLTAFGGFGFLGDAAGWSVWLSITVGLLGGVAVAGGTFFLVVLPMSRQQGSVHVSEDDYLDREGQVTSEIPEEGVGRVTLVAPTSGARVSTASRSASGERIGNGTSVRIISVGTGVVTVVPIVTTTKIPTAEWPGRSSQ
jgi:membrane-bound ClpP family serine protease